MTSHLRPRRRVLAFLSCMAAAASLSAALLAASPAAGVVATDRGVGYLSRDGAWIGSYRLDDGSTGFCVNLGRSSPIGADFTPTDAASLGWYSADDRARLAYVARTWGATDDADTAAAAQFLTWQLTGFDGRSPDELLARAGDAAPRVREMATAMAAEADSQASRGVSAEVAFTTDEAGVTRVRADLDVERMGGAERLPEGAATGTIRLTGARFEDGGASTQVGNGVELVIVPVGEAALVEVAATADFAGLPFGDGAMIGFSPADVQNLLIASPGHAAASASATVQRPNELPFQPRVATLVSSATATAGDAVHDTLRVDAAVRAVAFGADAPGEAGPADGGSRELSHLSGAWGLIVDGDGFRPVPVVVRSRLIGPLDAAPEESVQPPAAAPVACEVTTQIADGPGEYATPQCTLREPGYYVWVDSVDPKDTPEDQGQSRVLPWQSRFGVASEVVQAIAPAPPASPAPGPAAPAGVLAETGTGPAVPVAAALAMGAMAIGILTLRRRGREKDRCTDVPAGR